MKILYQDLINLLSKKPSKALLSERLFQLGHEHEITGNIFNMELTPNRGDCLSITGLARELNIFFGSSEKLDIYENDIDVLDITFKNESPSDCPKISFLEIEIDGSITKYKSYIENYFSKIAGNKTNFFTDISNFVSYELGQPTHCYDAERINGDLIFDNKLCDSTFDTLLGSKINLKNNNCVFSIKNEIVNLAGVMGGASTACSKKTKKVLVECAYFNPESIIGKSIKYNINSDAAYKFERGVDSGCHDFVLRRFIKIVSDHANIISLKTKSYNFQDLQKKSILMDLGKINKIIGINIDKNKYINILKKLSFEIQDNKILVPTFRHDISTQNDLAEEVARVIGYDSIETIPISLPALNKKNKIDKIKYLESFFVDNGFAETINFPFSHINDQSVIKIDNPLDSKKQFLRTNLKSSLIQNFIYNQRRQKESIKIFEISDVYFKNPKTAHQKRLGVIVGGRQGLNYSNFAKKLSKEFLDNLLNKNLSEHSFDIEEIPLDQLDTKKKDRVFYAEIAIDDIPEEFFQLEQNISKPINFIEYKPISEFPSSTRDLSFSIKNPSNFQMVLNMLDSIQDEIVSKSYIFDFYINKKDKTIKLGYRIIFQSKFRTLSDDEIKIKLNNIIKPILEIDKVFIQGM